MKSGILLFFITTTLFTFSQVESKEAIPAERKSQIGTQKEVETKIESQSLSNHPFIVKRNEYVAQLSDAEKNSVPTFRSTETSEENLNRLIKWAFENKDIFDASHQATIDKDFNTL